MSLRRSSRRDFLKTTTLAATVGALGLSRFPSPAVSREVGVLSKLNIAHVGVARRGAASVDGCKSENQIVFCDVDQNYLDALKDRYPNAAYFADHREALDKFADKLDAIVVATADHTHAPIAVAGMKLGLHCYSEKPLGHDLHQIRAMRKAALDKNLVTQMGTQIHAGDNYRRVVELIQSGAIGTVENVEIWCQNRYVGQPKPTEATPCPPNLNWDAWLGPAKERDFDPRLVPGTWRMYWEFGNGAMGDMACHYMDLPYWALGLQYPISVETTSPNPVDPELCGYDLTAKYEFPALDGGAKPLTLTWRDGQARPDCLKDFGVENYGAGVLFFGTDGVLFATYEEHKLFPTDKFDGFQPPAQTIPKSLGHHAEWIDAIKRGAAPDSTTCHFEYSGKIAEAALLGVFSYRVGKKLVYDAENVKAVGCPEADQYFKQYYRPGWEV